MTRRRAVYRPRPRCVPAGPLAEPTFPARRCGCGVELRMVDNGRGEWMEVGPDGRSYRDDTPEGLKADPAKWWADLLAAHPGRYSSLKAAIDLGCWSWHHYHRAEGVEPYAGPVPECCGSPMWASPRGWACRKTGDLFPYVEEVAA